MKNIFGIMATTHKGVIGHKGFLPWDYPDELQHFKDTVRDHVIVVGRKTFASLPEELKHSCNIVIFSRQKLVSNYATVASLDDFWTLINQPSLCQQKIFMIGGAEIAHLFLQHNLISHFILTKIHQDYAGDTYLNLIFFDNWPQTIIKTTKNYTIVDLINPNFTKDR